MPVIPVLFYHGKKPVNWSLSLQQADFREHFSKIPMESRKSMLNYGLKLINTHDPKIRRAFQNKRFKGRGILSLLSEIWSIRKPTPSKVAKIFLNFKDIFKDLTVKQREDTGLKILEYLMDNTGLDFETWKESEKLIIKAGIFTRGGVMDIREIIEEKGREKGRQEGRQQVILNMLKKKLNISFISKVTGLPEEEIKKLKNNSVKKSN